jgi:uncharacterized protein
MTAPIPERHRAIAWVKDDPFGVEFAELDIGERHMTANGVAIGTRPVPYRLDYELVTATGFVTTSLRAISRGETWRRELDLRRDADGVWSVAAHSDGDLDLPPAGGDVAGLVGALDCDLGLSPVTNMMPILRHGLLHGGGPIECTMAWVAVPELTVHPDGQRYHHVTTAADHHVIRFEAIDGTFAADITVDADAVVVDYPGIAHRMSGGTPPPRSGER